MSDSESETETVSTENRQITTAVSTASQKVIGETDGSDATGVLGRATDSSGQAIGVIGETQSTTGSAGVVGQATASSGFARGVVATTESADGIALVASNAGGGVAISADGDTETDGDHEVTGSINSTGSHTLTVDGVPALGLGSTGTDVGGNTAGGNVIGGFEGNAAGGNVGATVGGGGSSGSATVGGTSRDNTNEVTGNYGTVGGGVNNRAGPSATVGGGENNTASANQSTVSGGLNNVADTPNATVGGGEDNSATEYQATVGGGIDNLASEVNAVVAGGIGNQAAGIQSVVGGGTGNEALDTNSTIAGGSSNDAYGHSSTIGGGSINRTGQSGTDAGQYATVPGGRLNVASGDYSFAAGRGAEATNLGAFVWSDSSIGAFSSTSADQFLIDANGGTGIGTSDPVSTLHVRDSVAESGADNLGRHVVAIENTSTDSGGSTPDGLGIEFTNITDPGEFNSYISFMDSTGTIGNIQGDGAGGVEFVGSLADFAEFFPKADRDVTLEDGQVVGLRDGEVVADVDGADAALVVSTAPLVSGNRPVDEAQRDDYVKLTLVGQVPVRVSGPVEHGDTLVASPDGDGTAVALADGDPATRPVVGLALESHDGAVGDDGNGVGDGEIDGPADVRALVGGPGIDATPTRNRDREATGASLRRELDARDDRIADLERENDRLRDRLAAVESRLGIDEAVPADD